MAAMGGGECGGWVGDGRVWGVGVGGGLWRRRVGEVGVFSKVGGTETPLPFDEADFMA